MKRFRIFFILAIIVIVLVCGYGYYLYNKPHRQIDSEKVAESLKAEDLFKKYSENEEKANAQFLDKVIQIEGKVKEISKNDEGAIIFILESGDEMAGINCTLDLSQKDKASKIKSGSTIILKGLCTGMLMDVVLIKCFLVQ